MVRLCTRGEGAVASAVVLSGRPYADSGLWNVQMTLRTGVCGVFGCLVYNILMQGTLYA
jgi:hypothetical protein